MAKYRRNASQKARIWLVCGVALGGLSVIPFVLTFNTQVETKTGTWGVGLNNWATKTEYVDATTNTPIAPVESSAFATPTTPTTSKVITRTINMQKYMYLKQGGGFFGNANYPTNYFKYYDYVDQCSKFNDEDAVYDQVTALAILDKLNTLMIFVYTGIAASAIAGLMIIISLNVLFPTTCTTTYFNAVFSQYIILLFLLTGKIFL